MTRQRLVDGVLEDMSADEIAMHDQMEIDWVTEEPIQRAAAHRQRRDQLLQECDWWGNSDVTMTAAQTTYRQAWRDITSKSNWPNLEPDDWPVKP